MVTTTQPLYVDDLDFLPIKELTEEHESFQDYSIYLDKEIVNNNIQDINLNITISLIHKHLFNTINYILKDKSIKYSYASVKSINAKNFIDELTTSHFNVIHNFDPLIQQLFLLHQICNGLYYYNNNYFKLNYVEFRTRVLFPNLIYIMVRFFQRVNKFFQTCIKNAYNTYKDKYANIIKRYISSYYCDEDIIKTDILYTYLGNGLRKQDPRLITHPKQYYLNCFKSLLYFYFKSEEKNYIEIKNIVELDSIIDNRLISSPRQKLYKDVLFELHIEKKSKNSPLLIQLNYNFNIFRNVIINNEFQDIFLMLQNDLFPITNTHYKLINIYSNIKLLNEIKKLPIIYKLIRCIHIRNDQNKIGYINPTKFNLIKTIVLEELISTFKTIYDNNKVISILDKTAHHFSEGILSGEYINLITLTAIKLDGTTFYIQIRKFIQLILSEVNFNGEGTNY